MAQQLSYGLGSTLRMDLPAEAVLADLSCVPGKVLREPRRAVSAALLNPIGYPSIASAVVPGDRIAIAVDPELPCADELVAGVLDALSQTAVSPADIVVLTTDSASRDRHRMRRLAGVAEAVAIAVHDPRDRADLCYLAASKDADPIYLNRHLCEADLIIPLSLLRPRRSLGYTGVHGGLYPAFGDEAARRRSRVPASVTRVIERRRRRAEAAEVAWLLGIPLTVQVVPGQGDSVLHVVAGAAEEAAARGMELVEAAWSHRVPARADLVVAAMAGDDRTQTWPNFGRALHAAAHICSDHGTIILCTDMKCPPGPALERLIDPQEDGQLLRRLHRDRSEDAVSASLLLRTRERQHVYLLSQLDETSVEGMGVGYLAGPEQVVRLSRQFATCILLADAHRAAAWTNK